MAYHYECPYCEKGHNDIDDMYEEDGAYEVECTACEKLFYVSPQYSVNYVTRKYDSEKG